MASPTYKVRLSVIEWLLLFQRSACACKGFGGVQLLPVLQHSRPLLMILHTCSCFLSLQSSALHGRRFPVCGCCFPPLLLLLSGLSASLCCCMLMLQLSLARTFCAVVAVAFCRCCCRCCRFLLLLLSTVATTVLSAVAAAANCHRNRHRHCYCYCSQLPLLQLANSWSKFRGSICHMNVRTSKRLAQQETGITLLLYNQLVQLDPCASVPTQPPCACRIDGYA